MAFATAVLFKFRRYSMIKCAIGQDSHRFEPDGSKKPLMLGGVHIPGTPGLIGNSDADVVLHAITNAISGISGVNILGKVSDDLCLKEGITDSRIYLKKALEKLEGFRISHLSISMEGKRPKVSSFIPQIKSSLAELMSMDASDIGITATSGEELTSFGRGEGIQVLTMVTAEEI